MLDRVCVVALVDDAGSRQSLSELASSNGWDLALADDRDDAFARLSERPAAILICDADLDWRAIMRDVRALSPNVATLLASNVADEYLWREVIEHSGFDLVTKPFGARLARAVRFAWAGVNWR